MLFSFPSSFSHFYILTVTNFTPWRIKAFTFLSKLLLKIALRKKSEKENEDIGLSTILRTVSLVSTCMLQQLPVGSVQWQTHCVTAQKRMRFPQASPRNSFFKHFFIFILNTVFLLLYTRFKRLRNKIMRRQKEESRHEWESGREELKSQWGLVDKCVCLCGCVWMFVCSSYQY